MDCGSIRPAALKVGLPDLEGLTKDQAVKSNGILSPPFRERLSRPLAPDVWCRKYTFESLFVGAVQQPVNQKLSVKGQFWGTFVVN